MAQSIRNIISGINESLAGVFKGSTLYGVATLTERDGKGSPMVDEKPVGFDDSYALQSYHRLGDVAVTYSSGYGDQQNTVNTFQVSMLVFNNKKQTKLNTDEIAMIVQSVLGNKKINSVRILPTRIILNSQQIFTTEYRGVPYPFDEDFSLMQINYTVEVTFKSGCFDLCPEEFSQCKTF